MCADFRVKCEVEVKGLTALFFMPHTEGTPYLRFLAGGYLRKAPGNIAESAVLPYPVFPCGGGKASRYSSRVPTTHGSPDPSCGKRGAEEQAAYEQNARTTWRFRNSYVRLL